MGRVILDTGVLIGAAVQRIDFGALFANDDVAVPPIVLAEYLVGGELDGDSARKAIHQAFLEELLASAVVEDYTVEVASHHAELIAHTRRTGRPRGGHDLIIAATARATRRVLLTTDNRARYDELPGVQSRVVPML